MTTNDTGSTLKLIPLKDSSYFLEEDSSGQFWLSAIDLLESDSRVGPYMYASSAHRWAAAHYSQVRRPSVKLAGKLALTKADIIQASGFKVDQATGELIPTSKFLPPTDELVEQFKILYGDDANYAVCPLTGRLTLQEPG